MSHSIFGWDLPPGCSVSDIPGNRPEDGKLEEIELAFYENTEVNGRKRFTPEEWKYLGSKKRTTHLEDIIWKAIEYGMEIGGKGAINEEQLDRDMRKWHIIEEIEKLELSKDMKENIANIIKDI